MRVYLDAAHDRMVERIRGDFETMVEAVRIGTVIASNARAHGEWRRASARPGESRGLAGAELEAAVMAIAASDPGLVAVVRA